MDRLVDREIERYRVRAVDTQIARNKDRHIERKIDRWID